MSSRWRAAAATLTGLVSGTVLTAAAAAGLSASSVASQVQECLLANGGEMQFDVGARYQFSPEQLRKALGSCRQSVPGLPKHPRALGTSVALRMEATESPPAWSASDRLRLSYELTRELQRVIFDETGLDPGRTASVSAGAQLAVRIEYGGSQFTQQTLDQWLQPARRLTVRMRLESADRDALAQRAVQVTLSPTLRQVDDGNSTRNWFVKTLRESGTATRQLLAQLANEDRLFTVSRVSDGTLAVNLAGIRNTADSIQFLLIPLAGEAFEAEWQTAAADLPAAGGADLSAVSLKISDGDTRRCAEQRCMAWPIP